MSRLEMYTITLSLSLYIYIYISNLAQGNTLAAEVADEVGNAAHEAILVDDAAAVSWRPAVKTPKVNDVL